MNFGGNGREFFGFLIVVISFNLMDIYFHSRITSSFFRLVFLDKCSCKTGCKKGGVKNCPCVIAKRNCGIKCKCRKCENNKTIKKALGGKCRCGTSVQKKFSCVNVEGERASKCPCLRSKQGCKECLCLNCSNPFGINKPAEAGENPPDSKKKPSLHKLMSEGKQTSIDVDKIDCWNTNETVSLYVVAEMVRVNRGQFCFDSICTLYDIVSKNTNIGQSVFNTKTKQQILSRLQYLGIF